MQKHFPEVGQQYGRLTVLETNLKKPPRKGFYANCRCSCGKEYMVDYYNLCNHKIVSCGCYRLSRSAEIATRHGVSYDYMYSLWWNIKNRCYEPSNSQYYNYGARGIEMSDNWKNDVVSFVKDIRTTLGDRPDESYSLDRIDNNKNYTLENLRWANSTLSAANKRKSKSKKYKWISKRKSNKFRGEISFYKKVYYTPDMYSEVEAAIAADFLAVKLWKDAIKHTLNFPDFYDKYARGLTPS